LVVWYQQRGLKLTQAK
jgi:ribonuclease HI